MLGVVYAAGGPMCFIELSPSQILEGIVAVPCFECGGDSRGFELPDGRFQPCGRCKGRATELVAC